MSTTPPVGDPQPSRRLPVVEIALGAIVLALGGAAAWHLTRPPADPSIVEGDGEVVCHLGDVVQGGQVTRTVPIRNRGREPLTVEAVTRSCTCLGAELDRAEIPPGEAANLTVTLTTPDRQGGFSHELAVMFAGEHPPTTVRFLGAVGAWIEEDSAGVSFGDVCPGDAVRQSLRLRVAEDWPADHRQIECRIPHGRVEAVRTGDSDRDVECTFAFEPPADAVIREYDGDIVISWAGHESRVLKLPCRGRVVSEWTSDPGQVALGSLAPGRSANFALHIRNRRHSGAVLARYRVAVTPGDAVALDVRAEADGWSVSGAVSARSDVPGVNRALVRVTGPGVGDVFSVPVYWETMADEPPVPAAR